MCVKLSNQIKAIVCLLPFLTLGLTSCGMPSSSSTNYHNVGNAVNNPVSYPITWVAQPLNLTVNIDKVTGTINPRVFGTNLEWFNDAGGLNGHDVVLKNKIIALVKQQNTSVMRFPGGTLADFYHWRDGVGSVSHRPNVKHPTDPGTSNNEFGMPEFYQFLKDTHSEALITVNAGTGTAQEAADWVAYANKPNQPERLKDGIAAPMNIKLWEIGNELYLPGNPGEPKITVTPTEYAKRYVAFSRAMKAVDPTITTVAIGVAIAHQGPATEFKNWSEVLLQNAADDIDMIAVHNAYFPVLINERQPHVKEVYPSLWAAPEAVDKSLTELELLIHTYQKKKKIGIAVTEWGALYSLPDVDNYWLDHVKTMGSGVYVARLMQVFLSHSSVELANYFKLVDRSYMGWISLNGEPKVPFWVVTLFANNTGNERLQASINSPVYNSNAIGTIKAESNVPEVTVIASQSKQKNKLYVNLVNRSMQTGYPINLDFKGLDLVRLNTKAKLLTIQANEITAHNGVDLPPEWPYGKAEEPYSTATPGSIKIREVDWDIKNPIKLPPFSVATLVVDTVD
jgi:alpha-L-arabinofuranosidase